MATVNLQESTLVTDQRWSPDVTGRIRRLATGTVGRTIVQALPPRLKVSVQYAYHFGALPNLRRPTTYSEKIQYRKFHDHDPRMAPLIDKIAAKEIVGDIVGTDWLIPTLWSGSDPDAIPFDSLTAPYVIKASHASNCTIFVFEGQTVDHEHIRAEARRWLKLDHARYGHEWAYSQVEPGILIEPFIGQGTLPPVDLKFMVFGGRVHHIEVCDARGSASERWITYDRDWNWQPILNPEDVRPRDLQRPAPENLAAMIEAAETLAAPFSFARVDFYEVGGQPLFGEVTFYPAAGYCNAYGPEYERILGDLWRV